MNIVCYTGFTVKDLIGSSNESRVKLLGLVEALIDGPCKEELKDLALTYRGSKNQRIIDVKASLRGYRAVIEKLHREAS